MARFNMMSPIGMLVWFFAWAFILVVGISTAIRVIVMALRSARSNACVSELTQEWSRVVKMRIAVGVCGVAMVIAVSLIDWGFSYGNVLIWHVAPLMSGIFIALGILISEAVVRGWRGPQRTARLQVRTVGEYLPRALAWGVTALVIVHIVFLAFALLTTSQEPQNPDMLVLYGSDGQTVASSGPYPGLSFVIPSVSLLVVALIVTVAALFQVVRRPQGYALSPLAEDELRKRSVTALICSFGGTLALHHISIAAIAAEPLYQSAPGVPWWVPALYAFILLSTTFAAVVAVWSLVAVRRVVQPIAPTEVAV